MHRRIRTIDLLGGLETMRPAFWYTCTEIPEEVAST